MKIKKEDTVIVLQGKDKGKTGVVLVAMPSTNKVVVSGVNIKKSFQKPLSEDVKGEILEKEYPIDVSNVAILDSKTKKPTRIQFKIEKGKKVRVAQKSGLVLK